MKNYQSIGLNLVAAVVTMALMTGCQPVMTEFSKLAGRNVDKSISLKMDGASTLSAPEGSSILIVPFMTKSRTEATTIVTTIASVRNDTADHFATVTYTTTVAAGQQSTAIAIPILHDIRYSGDRDYSISISSEDIGDTLELTATIEDLEAPPVVNFASSAVSHLEGAGTQSVGLTLSLASTNPVIVPFTVINEGADDPDRTFVTNSVTFAPGEITQSISYSIVDDSTVESSEDFSIALVAPPAVSATLGTSTMFTVTIVDDDQPAMPTALQLTEPSINISTDTTPTFLVSGVESGNTVRLYSDSTCSTLVASGVASSTTHSLTSSALAVGSYTFAATRNNSNGVFSACSTVTVSYVVDTTPVTITFNKLLDRFDEGSGLKNMSLTMSGTKPYPVVVTYTNSGTTATSDLVGVFASGTVTIPAGQTTASIPVTIGSDTVGNIGERRVQANITKTNSPMVRMGALTHARISIRDTATAAVNFASVSNGTSHSCGVSTTGKLYCWGLNADGQLGNGTSVDSTTPILIDSGNNYASVSAGYKSTCAITTTNVLKCWGSGYWGNIGDGTNDRRSTPTTIDTGVGYKKVSASYEGHTCGITLSDDLKCWGENGNGQLGDGTTVSKNVPTLISFGLGVDILDVSTGHSHTCAVTTGGELKCWGANGSGRLGDGTSTNRLSPVDIDAGGSQYTRVSLGYHHSCGTTNIGELKCWGRNGEGALGDGSTTDRNVPTSVWSQSLFDSVSAGENYTCAIANSTNALYCWGTGSNNRFGQVGDGTIDRKVEPQLVDSGVSYAFVDAGHRDHTCGITTTGLTKCWGANNYGKLGDGTISDKKSPVVTLTDATYSKISVNEYHGCGITSTGALRCWGNNAFSQLGDGTTILRSVPVEIDSEVSYSKISTGRDHGCAITSTGAVKCWGRNDAGQVASGMATTISSPIIVDAGVSYKEISAGINHTCGITSADVLKCWGGNGSGQSNVDPGVTYKKVAVSSHYTCGVTTAGVLKCWGSNWHGNLGDGTTDGRTNPVVIDAGTSYLTVSLTERTGCAVTTSNDLRCWGSGYYGQLGDGFTSNRMSPVTTTFATPTAVADVSVGYEHTCALSTTGTLTCFGGGGNGRLGIGTDAHASVPTVVDADAVYTSVSAGLMSTCGITNAGLTKCWGSNLGGRFGDGVLNHYPVQVVAP